MCFIYLRKREKEKITSLRPPPESDSGHKIRNPNPNRDQENQASVRLLNQNPPLSVSIDRKFASYYTTYIYRYLSLEISLFLENFSVTLG